MCSWVFGDPNRYMIYKHEIRRQLCPATDDRESFAWLCFMTGSVFLFLWQTFRGPKYLFSLSSTVIECLTWPMAAKNHEYISRASVWWERPTGGHLQVLLEICEQRGLWDAPSSFSLYTWRGIRWVVIASLLRTKRSDSLNEDCFPYEDLVWAGWGCVWYPGEGLWGRRRTRAQLHHLPPPQPAPLSGTRWLTREWKLLFCWAFSLKSLSSWSNWVASFFINDFFFKAISISNVGLEPTNPRSRASCFTDGALNYDTSLKCLGPGTFLECVPRK